MTNSDPFHMIEIIKVRTRISAGFNQFYDWGTLRQWPLGTSNPWIPVFGRTFLTEFITNPLWHLKLHCTHDVHVTLHLHCTPDVPPLESSRPWVYWNWSAGLGSPREFPDLSNKVGTTSIQSLLSVNNSPTCAKNKQADVENVANIII